jgi:hypothetical protein
MHQFIIRFAVILLTIFCGSGFVAGQSKLTFERDIQPILSRYGCNSGPCHGKARGQNGFSLSLLGYDNDFDHAAITIEGRGRRIFPASPEASLFLKKASGQVAHGGGKKLPVEDPNFEKLKQWVADGCPRTPPNAPKVERITVSPEQILLVKGQTQNLQVTAHYSDGTKELVTPMAMFQSSESVMVSVNPQGGIKAGPLPGEAAIMARFQERFAVCHCIIPNKATVSPDSFAKLPRTNPVDGPIWDKLKQLNLTPSVSASESTFLRRVHLDIIGRLPTPKEAEEFLTDSQKDKRTRLIDNLLARREYADHWANKWADLLRPNPYRVGIKAVYNFDGWIRDSFRQNKPYDQFVRELITSKGSSYRDGATVLFRDRREPEEATTIICQLFLGIRLDCAKCHHHPFEIWSQDDFYSMAAYFARLGHRGEGVSPPISGGEEILFTAASGSVKHPVHGKLMVPKPLFGKTGEISDNADPRESLAQWITSSDNPYFSRVIVNRVWADLMGRGLVEPVDDLRATNPATNGVLLESLAAEFRKQGYDLKKLIRLITTSHAYQLSSIPNENNASDNRNYSRHYRQRLRAEVLLDAVSDVTGIPEIFDAMPPGSRAVEAWTVRFSSNFLDSFGRPDPNQDPPCERMSESNVVQALHLMNSPGIQAKITAEEGRAAELAKSSKTNGQIVRELYLFCYSRPPNQTELARETKRIDSAKTKRREAIEDLIWAMLNTPEFVFKD